MSRIAANPNQGRLALSIGEAASRLGVHPDTVRAAISRGDVLAVRFGRRWLIPLTALDTLLAGNGGANGSEP